METNHEKINVRFAEFILKNYLREYDFFFDEEGKPHSPVEVWTLFKEEQKELESPLYNPLRRFEDRQERDLEENPYKGYSEVVRRDVMNDNPCEAEKCEDGERDNFSFSRKLHKETIEGVLKGDTGKVGNLFNETNSYKLSKEATKILTEEETCELPNLETSQDNKPKSALEQALEEQEEMIKRLAEIEARERNIELQLKQIKDVLKIGQE